MEKKYKPVHHSCDICDQHIKPTDNYCRILGTNGFNFKNNATDGYLYYHKSCIKEIGYEYIRNAYYNGDTSKLFGLQNYLNHKDFINIWLLYIECELDKKCYENVFSNLFGLLRLQSDGYHNRPLLRKIAIKLRQQGMKLEVFLDELSRHKECSCMDFLFRQYFMLYLEEEQEDFLKTMDVISSIRPRFKFAEVYFNGRREFFRDLLTRTEINDRTFCKSEALAILGIRKRQMSLLSKIDKHIILDIAKKVYQHRNRSDDFKELTLYYIGTFDDNELNDFFIYAYNFNEVCKKWPDRAISTYFLYRSKLNSEAARCAGKLIHELDQKTIYG
jgi:hypothetical protein